MPRVRIRLSDMFPESKTARYALHLNLCDENGGVVSEPAAVSARGVVLHNVTTVEDSLIGSVLEGDLAGWEGEFCPGADLKTRKVLEPLRLSDPFARCAGAAILAGGISISRDPQKLGSFCETPERGKEARYAFLRASAVVIRDGIACAQDAILLPLYAHKNAHKSKAVPLFA